MDLNEFRKAVKDFRVQVAEKDIERLFNAFDKNRSGTIDYDEFLRGVRVCQYQIIYGLVFLIASYDIGRYECFQKSVG